MSEFGLAYLKKEGAFVHPDDPHHGYYGSDENEYFKRLKGYAADNQLTLEQLKKQHCSRPHLLEKVYE